MPGHIVHWLYPYIQDKYILTSMSILCCICVWHAIINVVITSFSSRVADLADKVALGVLAFVYIGFHVLFVAIIVFVVSDRYGLSTMAISGYRMNDSHCHPRRYLEGHTHTYTSIDLSL